MISWYFACLINILFICELISQLNVKCKHYSTFFAFLFNIICIIYCVINKLKSINNTLTFMMIISRCVHFIEYYQPANNKKINKIQVHCVLDFIWPTMTLIAYFIYKWHKLHVIDIEFMLNNIDILSIIITKYFSFYFYFLHSILMNNL